MFQVGDRVRVTGTPHEPGQRTGRIAELAHSPAYGIVFDPPTDGSPDDMAGEVHRWYVGDELAPESGGAAPKPTPAPKSRSARDMMMGGR